MSQLEHLNKTSLAIPTWLKKRIEDEHAKHSPEFGGYLSNHAMHGMVALYYMGGSEQVIDHWYKHYAKNLEKIGEDHGEETAKRLDENWKEKLGQKDFFPDYVSFFKRRYDEVGREGLINTYLVEMMDGVYRSAFHCLIEIGFGLRAHHDESVVRGLAYLASSYGNLGEELKELRVGIGRRSRRSAGEAEQPMKSDPSFKESKAKQDAFVEEDPHLDARRRRGGGGMEEEEEEEWNKMKEALPPIGGRPLDSEGGFGRGGGVGGARLHVSRDDEHDAGSVGTRQGQEESTHRSEHHRISRVNKTSASPLAPVWDLLDYIRNDPEVNWIAEMEKVDGGFQKKLRTLAESPLLHSRFLLYCRWMSELLDRVVEDGKVKLEEEERKEMSQKFSDPQSGSTSHPFSSTSAIPTSTSHGSSIYERVLEGMVKEMNDLLFQLFLHTGSHDFFLLHGITAFHAFRACLKEVKKEEDREEAVRMMAFFLIALYIVRRTPIIHALIPTSSQPTTATTTDTTTVSGRWEEEEERRRRRRSGAGGGRLFSLIKSSLSHIVPPSEVSMWMDEYFRFNNNIEEQAEGGRSPSNADPSKSSMSSSSSSASYPCDHDSILKASCFRIPEEYHDPLWKFLLSTVLQYEDEHVIKLVYVAKWNYDEVTSETAPSTVRPESSPPGLHHHHHPHHHHHHHPSRAESIMKPSKSMFLLTALTTVHMVDADGTGWHF